MMFKSVAAPLFTVLMAGRALAFFNVSLDGVTLFGRPTDLTAYPANDPAVASCVASNTNCTDVGKQWSACQENDASCFCKNETVAQLVSCNQCQLDFLVAQNIKPSSPIVGANTAVAGILASCKLEKITMAKNALAIAPNWDGPFGVGLNLGGTVVVVGTGFLLGVSALAILTTLE